jgi:dTDP-4-amino-4,6-dideoxygalactose transaminase
LYVVQVEQREGVQQFLSAKGISTGIHYPIPIHLQEAYRDLGYRIGDFPVTEKCVGKILSLPMFPELSKQQVATVAEAVKSCVGKARNRGSDANGECYYSYI